jgi:gluconolactonase
MRSLLSLVSIAALLGGAACAGGSDNGGNGGSSGSSGTGGVGTGAGGGNGGSTAGTGGAGGGNGGSSGSGGQGGSSGAGGGQGGSSGAGGSGAGGAGGSASTAYKCPTGMTFTSPTAAVVNALAPQKVTGVPPADTFGQGFSILEGALWINDTLYLSQITGGNGPPPSRLLSYKPAGGTVTVLSPDLGGNGMAVDASGNIVAAVHKDGSIRRFPPSDPTMQTVLASMYMGMRFDSPNDLAVRSDGNIYFSDPDYQAPSTHPQTATRLYRISPTGTLSVVDATLNEPNGVTLSLDENTMFVSGSGGVFKFPLAADGTPGARAPNGSSSASLSGSDGMSIDCAGDLWVTTNANVVVVDPSGTEIGRFALTGVDGATNVAFGGADHKTVFITSRGSTPGLFTVTSPLPGMPY